MSSNSTVFRLEPVATVEAAVREANQFAKMRRSKGGILRMIYFGIKILAQSKPLIFWPLVSSIALLVAKGYIKWWAFPLMILVASALIIVAIVLRRYPLVKRDLSPAPTVKASSYYQSPELLALAWSKPVAKLYKPVISQPVEGYCGQATVLNVVHSIASHSHLPHLPSHARPITLAEMKLVCDQLPSFDSKLGITKVEAFDTMTLAQFKSHMEELNDPNVRYLGNFLRAPLFFNDPSGRDKANILKRIFGGHWSPLGAYVEYDGMQFVQVLDVNESYGTYMVPVHRLYDAVNTHDLSNGKPRGLIRVQLAASQ